MRRLLLAVVLLTAASACVRNPVTGKRQLALISEEQEIALGQEAKQEIGQGMGLVEDPGLQQYVSGIGMKLAKESERPNLPWSFQVIDDAAVNAFALPGGPIFVTRGILTHLNSEAELAIVLGHEIGHVTARHAVSMISKQQLTQLGLGVGTILLPSDLRGLGQLASAGAGLLFLRYGRDAERQSDELGYRYALEQRYDPREAKDVFETLGRTTGEQGRLPQWLSTHPDPENRVAAAEELVKRTRGLEGGNLTTGRAEYLAKLNGMVFGDNPRQGFFKGNAFLHPDLTFQLQFPSGWKAVNQAAAVTGISPNQDAIVQLSVAGTMSPEQAAQQFFSIQGIRPGNLQAGQLNTLPTVAGYFLADTEQGPVGGLVAFVSHAGKTFQIIGYTPAGSLQAYDPALRAAVSSFGPLTDPQALSVQPAKVEIVTVQSELSVAEAYAQFPSTVPLETFALINGYTAQERIPAGTAIKRVVGGTPAQVQMGGSP